MQFDKEISQKNKSQKSSPSKFRGYFLYKKN